MIGRNFFSYESQIKMIKKALKASESNPFLYKDEELIKLKTSLRDIREKKVSQRQFINGGFVYDT